MGDLRTNGQPKGRALARMCYGSAMQKTGPNAGRWLPVLAILALAACGQPAADNELSNADGGEGASFNLPAVALPDPPLDRAGLLAAVARASSANAIGTDDSEAQRKLDGRQFEVRIRFGCRGPATDLADQWLGWSFDPKKRRLSVHARPTITAKELLLEELDAGEFETVEGFWIPRPWLLSAACPAAAAVKPVVPDQTPDDEDGSESAEIATAASPGDPVPRGPRIGIAQFFSETSTRTARRGDRPYQAVKILEDDRPIGSQGFTLVLSGRLREKPGMGVIGCVAHGHDSPPDCVVSADFDRVWIERPDTREVIAQWTSG